MTAVLWNATPLRRGATLPAPRDEDFPACGFEHARPDFVRERSTDYVRRVLDAIPLEGSRRHVVVEVRVSEVVPGRTGGLLGWHMDTVGDPAHPSRPEVHHLFVTGTASLTEFVAEPVRLETPAGLAPHALMRALDRALAARTFATVQIPSCRVVTYGRFDLHRATPGLAPERRLLVRVTETDVLRPRDREVRRVPT